MTDEQRVAFMNEKLGAKCDFYLCTIFDEAVYIANCQIPIRNERSVG
jgi:hypothetical protein